MTINETLERYSQARRDLTAFDLEFAPIFEQRATLDEELKAAQANLTEAMNGNGIDFVENDDFGVSLVRTDRGAYNPDKLPKTPHVLNICTLSVSKSDIEKLVKKGLLSAEDAENAWESKPASPYVKVAMKQTTI